MNIQQQTTLGLSDTETMMADNEEIDHPPPQDTSIVFVEADLLYRSLSDSAKYKRAWLKEK